MWNGIQRKMKIQMSKTRVHPRKGYHSGLRLAPPLTTVIHRAGARLWRRWNTIAPTKTIVRIMITCLFRIRGQFQQITNLNSKQKGNHKEP